MLVTDGVGVRNFVHGRFLEVAMEAGLEVEVYLGVPLAAVDADIRRRGLSCRWLEMPIYRESPQSRFWRKTLELAHLKTHRTVSMQETLRRRRNSFSSLTGVLNSAADLFSTVCTTRKRILSLAAAHERSAAANPLTAWYRDKLRAWRPDLVFCTHQRPTQLVPVVAGAHGLGIPVASFIFSWDNLTSKGTMPARFDAFLVWSELMKSELWRFYPEIQSNRIKIVGAPQFEPYVYPQYGWSEAEFARQLGLRPGLRRLCFSCCDVTTSPNDPAYIRLLAEANEAGEFGEEIEIIVRPSPAEGDDRFAEVKRQFPTLKWSPPRWRQTRDAHPEPWSQRTPCREDLDLLKSVTQYCDLNVNIASTMSLDFAFAGRPVINVGLGHSGNPHFAPDRYYYSFDHYVPIVKSGGVRVVYERKDLVEAVRRYLREPQLDAEGRERMKALEVGAPLRGTSERLLQALQEIDAAVRCTSPS
jgi:hypothetical protein